MLGMSRKSKGESEVLKKRFQRRCNDFLGFDFSSTATKVVRLKRSGDCVTLLDAALLPPVDFSVPAVRPELPRKMNAYYGCLSYSGKNASIRVLHTPLRPGETEPSDAKLRELLSVKSDFRVASTLLQQGKGRQDSSLLGVAVPKSDIDFFLNMFPSGPPAPASLEVSGLAVIPAFLHARGAECRNEVVCLIEAGENISTFVFLKGEEVYLVGKHSFGLRALRERLSKDLDVNDELAMSILRDRSINISSSLASVQESFIKQLSVSKDFVERHENCKITKTYLSGGLSLFSFWPQEINQRLNTSAHIWSPLENIQLAAADVMPHELQDQATRFSAAIGAALGGLMES
ncbi:MAG: pilus assembly protein PilM [Pontiellaceae bacterium]|nr:pilus assembly protein PilM [Pontiellaceae bacterium]